MLWRAASVLKRAAYACYLLTSGKSDLSIQPVSIDMASTTYSPEIYGPGSYTDKKFVPIPDDARRVFEMLAKATPGFTQDPKIWNSVFFEGGADPIIPGPLKAPVVASALHAMCGVIANELLDERNGQDSGRHVNINTDHAAIWLGTPYTPKLDGMFIPELKEAGKLPSIFKKDFEKGAFSNPLWLRATAVYPTKTPCVWYQLHGSLDARPVLRAIGLDPEIPCETPAEAYDLISQHVQKFSADELEMINVKKGLCGNISYSPEGWRQTEMGKLLARHPLVNYKLQSHALPTPSIPLPVIPKDNRPLAGIKVVELVRIIAGPVMGTTLAGLGADVIRVNCGRLRDINSLQLSLNAGIRTIDVDLTKDEELARLMGLIQEADIFIQGFRPGTIARRGLGRDTLFEMAGKRGKGIVYLEENCYGPDGPFNDRPGWQQTADTGTGCSYVTGRSMGKTDGTSVLPSLPIPDMLTGLVGALGAMMAIRDRARQGGSYHVFAALAAASAFLVHPELGLYSPDVVQKCNDRFKWATMDPSLFVFELLEVVLDGWRRTVPELLASLLTPIEGDWGKFDLLKPVPKLTDPTATPHWLSAPVPNCYYDRNTISWL